MAMCHPPGDGQRPSPSSPLPGEGGNKRPGEDREQAGGGGGKEREGGGGGGAVRGGGGMAGNREPCWRARIKPRNSQTKPLPFPPPALSTPAGGTRRPSAPTGTSLRNATHLNYRSCFVLT